MNAPVRGGTLGQRLYPYRRCADQDAAGTRHPVVVVGAGPVGLALALDVGLRGVPVLVLDAEEGPGEGSRAICFAKRSLEIADRLGVHDPAERGVMWSKGKVFHRDRKVFEFDLLPEPGHRRPAFVNLAQPEFERMLVARIRAAQADGAPIELRGANRVTTVKARGSRVGLEVETPDGTYDIEADWLVACDGASSPIRKMLGLGFEGRVFRDSFLIADIRMHADFPTERWFWFDPAHGAGASTLLHRQPDGIWRVDFQIGWDVDREAELEEENVRKRLDAFLGSDVGYDIVWKSIYTFQCRRMTRFRHGRVVFAGDSAHQVSPFGARGANSGLQDADNLGWKLALVNGGLAPEELIDSYEEERLEAADENIMNSTRSTDFITPKSRVSRLFRDAVLDLAGRFTFARPMVNSGRLSVPCTYRASTLGGPDALPGGPARTRVGSPCPDAPLGDGFLLDRLGGGFVLMGIDADDGEDVEAGVLTARFLRLTTDEDPGGSLRERYLGSAPRALYLIRPDQHVAARWSSFDADAVRAALQVATGHR